MGDARDEVDRLFEMGEEYADAQEDGAALKCFRAAWDPLPEPRDEQGPAFRVLAAIADSHFRLAEWGACRAAVQHAFRCGADVNNPFLRLRLGQVLYELGDKREAANWLAPAYRSEGRALFQDVDPKYLEFVLSRLDPPPGGWPEGW
jgi:hypothetical protein